MAYVLQSYQPYAGKGIRIDNLQGDELMQSIRRKLERNIQQQNFPATVSMEEVKTGTGLFAQKVPMLVIRHPNPPFKYREVGVIVNGDTVTFPLWGRDVQKDRQESKRRAGLLTSLLMPGGNQLQHQQEVNWIQDIVDMINSGFEIY